MKLSDFSIRAYQNVGKKKSDGTSEDKFQKTVFEDKQSVSAQLRASQNNEKKQNDNPPKKSIIVQESDYEGNFQAKVAAKALTSGGLIKVPEQPKENDGRDNVYRRVAKFLLLIGVDEAAKIMPHLTEEQTEKIIPEIASIRTIDSDEAAVILDEFKSLVAKARESGGVDTAKNILNKAFGKDKADALMEKVSSQSIGKPFEYLQEADSDRVGILLKDESNPVRALVLSFLKPKVAAAVIQNLGEDDKKDVILRLAKLKEINPDIVKRVDQAMQAKMNSLAASKSDKIDGKSTLAQILKRMSPEAEQEILDNLSDQDPDLGSELREKLFTIEDILNADDRFIQDFLRDVDEEEIAYLLAGKDYEFRTKILSNVSENKRNSIIETEDFLRPMRKSDCEKATSKFFSFMRRAYEDGKLIINGRDDEIYV
ncbi:MAG: flagellar motor switch protein FliG [Treponema sp.]|nr:flagellar motor switch protein FliG [Candidatus Treponema equifaecale]